MILPTQTEEKGDCQLDRSRNPEKNTARCSTRHCQRCSQTHSKDAGQRHGPKQLNRTPKTQLHTVGVILGDCEAESDEAREQLIHNQRTHQKQCQRLSRTQANIALEDEQEAQAEKPPATQPESQRHRPKPCQRNRLTHKQRNTRETDRDKQAYTQKNS